MTDSFMLPCQRTIKNLLIWHTVFSHEFLLQEVLILQFLAYLLNKKKSKCMQNSEPLNSHTLRLYLKVGIQMPKKIFLRCHRWWENFSTEFAYSTLIQFRVCISLCQQIIVFRLPNELKETENDYCCGLLCGLHDAVVCIYIGVLYTSLARDIN